MNLPFSLLALIFTTSVASVPVETSSSLLLTPENFASSTARGTWLIEFYSPYCQHCRHFAPIWDQVYQHVVDEASEGEGSTLGVKLAKVDCATDGDLCGDQKVKGYPTLRIYQNGASGDEFRGDRSFDNIVKFIAKHAPVSRMAFTHTSTADETDVPHYDSDSSMPAASDESAFQVQGPRSVSNPNPLGTVLSLTPSNFASTIASGATFVKFFAPWCGHCKKLAPTWISLAEQLQHKMTVAEVNCEAYQSLCKDQGVDGYPMLYFYRQGHKLDYTGQRNLEAMETFSKKLMQPAVKTLEPSQSIESLFLDTDVIFLFLHLTVDARALRLVQDAGNKALMTPPVHVYTSTSPSLRSQYASSSTGPTLLVIKSSSSKRQDLAPDASLSITSTTTEQSINTFLVRHHLPRVSELTSENFQSVMNSPFKPLIVLLATLPDENRESSVEVFRAAEEQWRQSGEHSNGSRDVVWVYMDGEKWASWLKSMYGMKKSKLPLFVVADHSKLTYHDQYSSGKHFEFSKPGLVNAVNEALQSRLQYKNSENIFERFARFTSDYAQSIVDMFSTHPFRMVGLILTAVTFFAWLITRIVREDVGGSANGRLRLSEKSGRRLD